MNYRNAVIHALLKKKTTTVELLKYANQGELLCKELSNWANNYKRMLARKLLMKTVE